MDKPDRNDQQIRELFSTARQVDRETLPGYRSLRDAEPSTRRQTTPRRVLVLGLATATASIALAMTALFLVQDSSSPVGISASTSVSGAVDAAEPVDIAQITSPEITPGITTPEPAAKPRDKADTTGAAEALGKVAGPDKGPSSTLNERSETASGVRSEIVPRQAPSPPPSKSRQKQAPPRATDSVAAITGNEKNGPAPPPPPPPAAKPALIAERVTVAAKTPVVELQKTAISTEYVDQFAPPESPVPGRFYQNVLTPAPGISGPEGKSRMGGNIDLNALGYVAANVQQGAAVRTYAQAAGQLLQFEPGEGMNTETYDMVDEKGFVTTSDEALSTFSIDVDTASYSNIRRYLSRNQLPPREAVRIEEMINYFDYDYPEPSRGEPFSTSVDVAGCPWNAEHRLARIGIKGRDGGRADSEGTNLVFLIDVSGSMRTPNKLPLLKSAFAMLVQQLGARDQVAIVVYAGTSGLVLPSTSGADGVKILNAINRLEAGGSTNGGAGIELAYKVARENFIRGGVNRVVLATDGDFNVGHTNGGDLLRKIKDEGNAGIALTALGFGMGNLKDATLELLADKGDGNYFYIDNQREAHKVLVEELQGTLVTIAKDVKIQVEFNPAEVAAYRLIGYENRALAKQDFNDDKKDAGEIGSGHTVTALYELVPAGTEKSRASVDPLKYQRSKGLSRAAESGELFTLKVRYKEPEESRSRLLQFVARDDGLSFEGASPDFRFAAAVASFGMVLRDSEHRGTASLDGVAAMLEHGVGFDKGGYRAGFHTMVQQARTLPRR